MPSEARLQVVIVSYNVKHYAAQAIRSVLRAASHLQVEIWVVDNASSDGSVEYLRSLFPHIHITAGQENVGFSRANNHAIRQSNSEYILLLNPDTIIAEDTLTTCIAHLDAHPDAGAIGVCMQDAFGRFSRESRRALPTPWVSFLKMLGRDKPYYMSHLPLDRPSEIEVLSGAFMMLRRSALDAVGLLDEQFFMYGEDIDLSYRMLLGGWHNWYLPCHMLHYKGESTQKTSLRYVKVFYNAMLIFYNKHFAHRYRLLTHIIRVAVVARGAIDFVQQKCNAISAYLHPYRREDETYLLSVSPQLMPQVESILQAHHLPYHTTAQPDTSYTYLLCDDSQPYSDILEQSRQHQGRLLAIYSEEENQIITHCDVWR